MSGYAVGQVVVCVDNSGIQGNSDNGAVVNTPIEGGIYTVRQIRPADERLGAGLILAELINPVVTWPDGRRGEVAFHARRFRPAVETSLDVFEKMLAPMPHKREMEPA